MTWLQMIGAVLLASPFVAMAVIIVKVDGWRMAAKVFGLAAAIVAGSFLLVLGLAS